MNPFNIQPGQVVQAVIDFISNLLGLNSSNSLAKAIEILSKAPQADVNAAWFRAVLGSILAVTFLMCVLSLIFHGIVAVGSKDLAPFATALMHTVKVLLLAPFILLGVLLLLKLGHLFTEASIKIATLGSSPTGWQHTLIQVNPVGYATMKLFTSTLGVLLVFYVTPMQQAVYMYTIFFTLALGVGIGADRNGLLYRWTAGLLVAAIFSQPLMVFIMALGGNIMAHNTAQSLDQLPAVALILVLCLAVPTVLFLVTTHSLKKRQKAAKAEIEANLKVENNSAVSVTSGPGGQYAKQVNQPSPHAGGMKDAGGALIDGLAIAGAAAGLAKLGTKIPHPAAKTASLAAAGAAEAYIRGRRRRARGPGGR